MVLAALYQYFLKVVPTSYSNLRNETIYTNQFRCACDGRGARHPARWSPSALPRQGRSARELCGHCWGSLACVQLLLRVLTPQLRAQLPCRSVTEHFRETASPSAGGGQLPGVFLFYDLSPIKVGFGDYGISETVALRGWGGCVGGAGRRRMQRFGRLGWVPVWGGLPALITTACFMSLPVYRSASRIANVSYPPLLACRKSPFLPHLPPTPPPLAQVRFQESRISFLSFVTSLCAIIGGVFTGALRVLPTAGHRAAAAPAVNRSPPWGCMPVLRLLSTAGRCGAVCLCCALLHHHHHLSLTDATVCHGHHPERPPQTRHLPRVPLPLPLPAVSGIIDATVYHGQQAIKKKMDLGKLS